MVEAQTVLAAAVNPSSLTVPVGTTIVDTDSGDIIADLVEDGQKVIVARGGDGGLGNTHFKSSTNRTPRQCTHGNKGEFREVRLELKSVGRRWFVGYAECR